MVIRNNFLYTVFLALLLSCNSSNEEIHEGDK